MSDLYRELILDHYKNPRNHGELDPRDAYAQGTNPLCGDDVAISINFDDDTISEIRFHGRGCAISQASASILTEMVEGRDVQEVASLDKEELLDELGAPLAQNPARLKCALLGLGVLKLALHRAKGTPLPEEWEGFAER
jgi:nitrogen fixation NifU-like protein